MRSAGGRGRPVTSALPSSSPTSSATWARTSIAAGCTCQSRISSVSGRRHGAHRDPGLAGPRALRDRPGWALYSSADEGIELLPAWSARSIRTARGPLRPHPRRDRAADYDVFSMRARAPHRHQAGRRRVRTAGQMTSGSHDPPAAPSLHSSRWPSGWESTTTAYRYVRTGQLIATRRDGRWTVTPGDLATFERHQSTAAEGRMPPVTERSTGLPASAIAPPSGRLLAGDEAGAWRVVESALVTRMRPDRVHLDLLAPCLREIGIAGPQAPSARRRARRNGRRRPLGRPLGAVVRSTGTHPGHGDHRRVGGRAARAADHSGHQCPAVPGLGGGRARAEHARRRPHRRRWGTPIVYGRSGSAWAATPPSRPHAPWPCPRRFPQVPLLAGGPGVPDATVARRLGADAALRCRPARRPAVGQSVVDTRAP